MEELTNHSRIERPANLLPQNGWAYYSPSFFSPTKSEEYFKALQEEIHWKQEPITIMGKKILQPRLTAFHGDETKTYRYSGLTMVPSPWTPALLTIRDALQKKAGLVFTSVLCNQYRDGQDSMGWHRDNERELGRRPTIASVSFGAPRKFQFRPYSDKNPLISLILASGSLLVMEGETNQHWEHRMPKVTGPSGARVNLTFRVIQ